MTLDSALTNSSSNTSNENKFRMNIRVTVAANQGGRKYMEDRVHIETVRNDDGSVQFVYLAVYDGHGGYEASEYVKNHLMDNIVSSENFQSRDDQKVLEAIRNGFLNTHQQMWKVVETWPRTASGYTSTAGTTASVAIIRDGKIYTGHVGDSAIILGRKSGKLLSQTIPERLTIDHKPEDAEEEARIIASGGRVAVKGGVHRVVWTRPLRGHIGPVRRSTPTESIPFLAVARSLGDLWSYCEDTKEFVVSPEPDVAVRKITDNDVYLVLASDGLTNVLSPVQAMSILDEEERIVRRLDDECTEGLPVEKHTNHARALLSMAMRNWRSFRADNISAIAVVFDSDTYENWDSEPSVEGPLPSKTSVDMQLAEDPECMIRITSHRILKLATFRIPLLYQGAFDVNFTSVLYRGPGFLTHDEENEMELLCVKEQDAVVDDILDALADDNGVNETIEITAETSVMDLRTPEKNIKVDAKNDNKKESKLHKSEDGDGDSDEEEPATASSPKSAACSTEPSPSEGPSTPCQVNISERSIITRSLSRGKRTVSMVSNTNMTMSESRKIAVPIRRMSSVRRSIKNPKTSVVKIEVNEVEVESVGMTTRSRERQTTFTLLSPKTRGAPVTPACTSSRQESETPCTTACRKRPLRRSPGPDTGATPFLERLKLNSLPPSPDGNLEQKDGLTKSEPTTPTKASSSPCRGSKWSLSKLDELRNGKIIDQETAEPPSKMARIYNLVKRVFGSS